MDDKLKKFTFPNRPLVTFVTNLGYPVAAFVVCQGGLESPISSGKEFEDMNDAYAYIKELFDAGTCYKFTIRYKYA